MNALSIRTTTALDLPAVEQLLADAALPLAGVKEWLHTFLVGEVDGRVAACAGLELYGHVALLRSVAVIADLRGSGAGRRMVNAILDAAADRKVRRVFLLTTTAAPFFEHLGFHSVARGSEPAALRDSIEFREACPASATLMELTLPNAIPAGSET